MEYRKPRRRQRPERQPNEWDAGRLRSLRRHLGLSQQQLADELGMRQQTVSEWETSVYQPRGASARLLSLIAERAGFQYDATEGAGEARGAWRPSRGVSPATGGQDGRAPGQRARSPSSESEYGLDAGVDAGAET